MTAVLRIGAALVAVTTAFVAVAAPPKGAPTPADAVGLALEATARGNWDGFLNVLAKNQREALVDFAKAADRARIAVKALDKAMKDKKIPADASLAPLPTMPDPKADLKSAYKFVTGVELVKVEPRGADRASVVVRFNEKVGDLENSEEKTFTGVKEEGGWFCIPPDYPTDSGKMRAPINQLNRIADQAEQTAKAVLDGSLTTRVEIYKDLSKAYSGGDKGETKKK